MKSRIFTALSALSLLLGVATAMLWIRSHWIPDNLTRYRLMQDEKWAWGRELWFWSDRGRFTVAVVDQGISQEQKEYVQLNYREYVTGGWRWVAGQDLRADSYDPFPLVVQNPAGTHHEMLGFRSGSVNISRMSPPRLRFGNEWRTITPTNMFYRMRVVGVPYWFVLLLFLAIPTGRTVSWISVRTRKKHGRCLACGYSLTANTSGVCPECGTPVEGNSQVTA